MFKEGADWIWADRIIIVGVRGSFGDVVQMMGRAFRDVKDKHHVEVVQLLPFALDQQDDNFSDNLNNYLKAIYASLILEDILSPVKIVIPFSNNSDKDPEQDKTRSRITPMSELIPDESTRISVINDATNCLASLSDEHKKEEKSLPALYEEFQKTMPEILQTHGITRHAKEIGDQIWSMLVRRSLKMQGISIEDIDFNIVKSTHPLDGVLRYTSSACNIETLAQLREAIRRYKEEQNARWTSNYKLLEKYTEEYGHCRVPKSYEIMVDDSVVKLGSWYSDQKKNFHSLSQDKQNLLQMLPGFIAKKFHRNKSLSIDQWIDLFIFVSNKHGTPLIPNTHVENGANLGSWMQHIRKEEEWAKLTAQQKQLLLNNNFKLSPSKELEEAAVQAMVQFALREGTTVPKHTHKEEIVYKGVTYSIPLNNFRNKIKNAPHKVEKSTLEGLAEIPNFLEELHHAKEDPNPYLEKGLLLYEKFNKRTGLTIIPDSHMEDEFNLSDWNKKIRARKELDEAFNKKLLAIDPLFFAKHTVRTFFQDLYPRIEAFIEEKNHALISQGYTASDGYRLGEKVADLRERKGKLEKPITDYLNSLGSKWAWNYFEYVHLQSMQELLSYIDLNGYHQETLPSAIRALRLKVKKSITKYPSSEPLRTRIEKLAPNIFDEPKDEIYLALLDYATREGHACPPIKHVENGKKIGLHVSNIRQKYKNGHLPPDESAKYDSLPGWQWNASALQSSTIRKQNDLLIR